MIAPREEGIRKRGGEISVERSVGGVCALWV